MAKNVGDKIGALAFGGAVVLPVALLVAPVALPEVALGGAAGGGASLASRILLEVILEAALMQEGDRSPKKDDVGDDAVVVRGGESPMPPSGQVFSGAFGPTLLDAASGVPHGQIRHTTAGAIRESGGTVVYAPEPAYPAALDGSYPVGPINFRQVNITLGSRDPFVGPIQNPVPKDQRIPGRPKK